MNEMYFLKSANKDDEGFVRLRLTTDKERPLNTIYCKVLLDEYRELGVLPEGEKIRLHGEIEKADTWDILLKDCEAVYLWRVDYSGVRSDAQTARII